MTTRAQEHKRLNSGCMDKGKTPVVVSHRTNKRVYNECTSNQRAPNMVSHQLLMNMPLVERTSVSSHPYDILGEEDRIEKELMNESYEYNSQIMARLWEESRSDDELTNVNYEMNNQPNIRAREESRVEDEIMKGSYEHELDQGNDIRIISYFILKSYE